MIRFLGIFLWLFTVINCNLCSIAVASEKAKNTHSCCDESPSQQSEQSKKVEDCKLFFKAVTDESFSIKNQSTGTFLPDFSIIFHSFDSSVTERGLFSISLSKNLPFYNFLLTLVHSLTLSANSPPYSL